MDRAVHSSGPVDTGRPVGSPPALAVPPAPVPRAAGVRRPRPPAGDDLGTSPARERILAAALELFNERGTAAVTTHRIAGAAGTSTADLRRWFGAKQEIVRVLVGRWLAAVERQSQDAVEGPAHLHSLWEDLERTCETDRQYRFVRREAASLLFLDAQLASSYRQTYQRRLAAQVGYACRLVSAGMLREPIPPRTIEDLVVAIWLIVENWAAHRTLIEDDEHPSCATSGIRPLLVVLGPYLTPHGQRAFDVL